MNLVEEVKGRALAEGMDLVGATPIVRLRDAPEGHRPRDILPTARSVIVAGVHVLDSVYDLPYTRYEYTGQFFVLNSMLNTMAFKLSRYLESQGFRTVPIPAAYPRINKLIRGVFSHRHAAVQAGLGEIAMNNLLTTPQFGSRIRLVTIITEAPLRGDPPFEGILCQTMRPNCQLACVRNCPVDAIGEEGMVDKASASTIRNRSCPGVQLSCGVGFVWPVAPLESADGTFLPALALTRWPS